MPPKRKSTRNTHVPPPKRGRSTSAALSTGTSTNIKDSNEHKNMKDPIEYNAKYPDQSYIHLQKSTCSSICERSKLEINQFEKCASCIEKQAHAGTCRHLGIRVFKDRDGKPDYLDFSICSNRDANTIAAKTAATNSGKDKNEARRKVEGKVPRRSTRASRSVFKDSALEDNLYDPPHIVNKVVIDKSPEILKGFANYVLPRIAPDFGKMLKRELHHEQLHVQQKGTEPKPEISVPHARILPVPSTRAMCDICATSIFLGSYLCACCGKEFCLSCWKDWKPSDERSARGLPKHRKDQCTRHRRHNRNAFYFLTRAAEGEIMDWVERVETWAPEELYEKQTRRSSHPDIPISIPTAHQQDPRPGGPKYLPVFKAARKDVPLEKFQALWKIGGIPLVLTGFSERFEIKWTDSYLRRNYGGQDCRITNCETGETEESTVRRFFKDFSKVPEKSLKLKDWPPSADFADTFPLLFRDFENALPYPEYTTRNGPLNLASYFPNNWLRPDLGPKMYNAYPSIDFLPKDSNNEVKPNIVVKGTTNLHLDITDAINIMLHATGADYAEDAASVDKGIPFCGAIWDIFPPEASVHIRKYLKEQKHATEDDPIHRQVYYLDEGDLAELGKPENGDVKSYRIYQNPGEAVFIPAGCAHQVRNRRSCVKVAVDFLSCEHVPVCAEMIEENRSMSGGPSKMTLKEDVLQLWNCLMFAWKEFEKWANVEEAGIRKTGTNNVNTDSTNRKKDLIVTRDTNSTSYSTNDRNEAVNGDVNPNVKGEHSNGTTADTVPDNMSLDDVKGAAAYSDECTINQTARDASGVE